MTAWSDRTAVQPVPKRGTDGVPFEPIRAGNLLARLALGDSDIDAAQALRYRVFYDEMKAHPSPEVAARRRDVDSFDAFCDHLLVVDTAAASGAGAVVGTSRVMRRAAAARKGGFYSQS